MAKSKVNIFMLKVSHCLWPCKLLKFSRRDSLYNFRTSCRITLERKGRRRTAYLTRSIVLFIKSTPLTLFLHPTGRNFPTNKPIKLGSNLFDDANVVASWGCEWVAWVPKDVSDRLCRERIITIM